MRRINNLFLLFSSLFFKSCISLPIKECGDKCSKGFIYLSIRPELMSLQNPIELLQSQNSDVLAKLSLQKTPENSLVFSIGFEALKNEGIQGGIKSELRPDLVRDNENSTLVVLVNETFVCVLFENECNTDCYKIPDIIVENAKLFSSESSTEINPEISASDNKTEVYQSSEKCRYKLYRNDATYLNELRNEVSSIYTKLMNAINYFSLLGSDEKLVINNIEEKKQVNIQSNLLFSKHNTSHYEIENSEQSTEENLTSQDDENKNHATKQLDEFETEKKLEVTSRSYYFTTEDDSEENKLTTQRNIDDALISEYLNENETNNDGNETHGFEIVTHFNDDLDDEITTEKYSEDEISEAQSDLIFTKPYTSQNDSSEVTTVETESTVMFSKAISTAQAEIVTTTEKENDTTTELQIEEITTEKQNDFDDLVTENNNSSEVRTEVTENDLRLTTDLNLTTETNVITESESTTKEKLNETQTTEKLTEQTTEKLIEQTTEKLVEQTTEKLIEQTTSSSEDDLENETIINGDGETTENEDESFFILNTDKPNVTEHDEDESGEEHERYQTTHEDDKLNSKEEDEDEEKLLTTTIVSKTETESIEINEETEEPNAFQNRLQELKEQENDESLAIEVKFNSRAQEKMNEYEN